MTFSDISYSIAAIGSLGQSVDKPRVLCGESVP